jgi:SAM-dependent methyltransferase
MHDTALKFGEMFFNAYVKTPEGVLIVDIGSQDVTGSLRDLAPSGSAYVGVDFVQGKGVDVVITDPYALPFEADSVDVCVCSSCFEHSEFFWLLYLEVMRILKPSGVFYLNTPSNGAFHRYPVDCWRFYPDSGAALSNWGRRNGYNNCLLESFVGEQKSDIWNDFVAVFLKDESFLQKYPQRIQESLSAFTNGLVYGNSAFTNPMTRPEDQKIGLYKRIRKTVIREAVDFYAKHKTD